METASSTQRLAAICPLTSYEHLYFDALVADMQNTGTDMLAHKNIRHAYRPQEHHAFVLQTPLNTPSEEGHTGAQGAHVSATGCDGCVRAVSARMTGSKACM